MSDTKEPIKQQVLFDELPRKSDKKLPQSIKEQVILDEENFKLAELEQTLDQLEETQSRSKPNWLLRGIFSIAAVLIGWETADFLIAGFEQAPIVASLYAVLTALILTAVAKVAVREYRGLRALKKRQYLQQQASELVKGHAIQSAESFCQSVMKSLPVDVTDAHRESWQQAKSKGLSEQELMSLFSREVLTDVDRKVLDKVAKYSTEAVVVVALSPIAIVDMGVMFWRNIKMIDEVAELYGLKLGYWSRVRLIKHVIINMLFAGASELIADLGTELLSADMLGKLSARLAQGLGAGMLTARLGIKAMHMCRPIAFEQNPPKLNDVRKNIITKIKSLAKPTK